VPAGPALARLRETVLVGEFPYATGIIDSVLRDLAGWGWVYIRPILIETRRALAACSRLRSWSIVEARPVLHCRLVERILASIPCCATSPDGAGFTSARSSLRARPGRARRALPADDLIEDKKSARRLQPLEKLEHRRSPTGAPLPTGRAARPRRMGLGLHPPDPH
jgi:hypothetical protein